MPVYNWSTTAASNATADATINWAEGMAPSAVNDSARAEMAAVAKWRNDISGANTTAGTSTAYTLATASVFDTLAHMDKALITFIAHTTSGASPTLAVDGLTAKAINGPSATAIATGALISGNAYSVIYDNANNQFLLLNYRDKFINATVSGTLAVTGASTLSGAVTFAGGGALGGGTFSGTATFSGALTFSAKCSFTSTDSIAVANGTTGQRNGSPAAGDTRYNSTLSGLEFYNGTFWATLAQAPTVQTFTSGSSATYTPSTGTARVRVRMCGGGAGGGAATTNDGSNGNDSSFGSWTAKGGSKGTTAGVGGAGGTGGASGTGTQIVRLPGGRGGGGIGTPTTAVAGSGGANPLGGGAPNGSGAGNNGATNTGAGGAGGGSGASAGGGGGAGEYVEFWVTNPGNTTYTVGAAANGGAAGAQAGGNGAAGIIIIEEFYS